MKQCKFEYIVTFPKTKHLYHHTGIAAGVTAPLDPCVNDFIKKLIRSGFRRVKESESRAADFVTDILFEGASKPDRYRGRFFPERRKIRDLKRKLKLKTDFQKSTKKMWRTSCRHVSKRKYDLLPGKVLPF